MHKYFDQNSIEKQEIWESKKIKIKSKVTPRNKIQEDSIEHLLNKKVITKNPLHHQIASVSVGIYNGTPVLDLDYAEDSNAETDMNVVMNNNGGFIEVQGTAEGHPYSKDELNSMLELAEKGIKELITAQSAAIENP